MRKKILVSIILPFFTFTFLHARVIEPFSLQEVKLLPSPFKEAEQVDLKYIMALDPDRLLAPFLREAGLTPKAKSYTNWENTGLDGHMGGHYLTALSLMYASTGDTKVLSRLNYMLDELAKCQEKTGNGYIGGVPGGVSLWRDISKGKLDVGAFSINGKWVPLYNIHKTYAGLRDAWIYAKSEKAKAMLVRYCDWMLSITNQLSDEQIQQLLRSEHGGLNEVFADVAKITGDQKYLKLAYRFSHQVILTPLEHGKDQLNGLHANTQIPKVIGFERIAEIAHDSAYGKAARFFWDNVVNHRSCAIGGNSVREHFHPANNFSTMITSEQGPETCNTYNMLKLTKMLYEADGDEHYIDYYERALYNHILSTQHPDRGGFVYFTPMRPGHYRVYSQPQTSMWCCVGTGMENHAKYNELIYAHSANDLFVNLFIPSVLHWKEKGVTLTQTTHFPEEENSTLCLTMKKSVAFSLQLRCPGWVAEKGMKVYVNGKVMDTASRSGSYITVSRKWKSGDVVKLHLPMRTTVERMPDGSDYYAVLHGPIVLAAKTDNTNLTGLFADDSRGGHVASGRQVSLPEMPMFAKKDSSFVEKIIPVQGKSFTFSAKELIYPERFKELELVPFYKIHDSRYIIYWQVETPDKIAAIQQKLAEEELARQQLAASTIDLVVCGEQQPESDHFIESNESNSGVNGDRHWRDAKGWFSYQLKDNERKADRLQITYYGRDKGRNFKIWINHQMLAHVTLDGSRGDCFYSEEYTIPTGIAQNETGNLVVKFEADAGSVAGGVYEVRLLKK